MLETLLELFLGRYVTLHDPLEFVAGVEGDDIARLDRDRLAGARVAPRTRRLAPDVDVAEARQLDVVAAHEGLVHQLEEGLDHVLRFALVQPEASVVALSMPQMRQELISIRGLLAV